MKVVTYSPFKPLKQTAINQFLDELAGRSMSELIGNEFIKSTPSVNIIENDNGYDIEIAAPGLAKNDFTISLDKDILLITGKKEKDKNQEETGKYARKEFNYAEFKRSFHIAEEIDREQIDARYAEGILTVSLAKKEEIKESQKTIEIN